MARGGDYRAPKLNRRVTLRNPASRPAVQQDRFGNIVEPTYGTPTWAARRDFRVARTTEEGVPVAELTSTFTIRYDAALAVVGDVQVIDGALTFDAVGIPLERGRRGGGASHLEIQTKVRA